jgi:hypothetical protein
VTHNSLTDFLQRELDRTVAACSSDRARLNLLAIQHGSWALRYHEFCHEHRQPFGHPHPDYGPMQATDFIIVLGAIQSAQAVIKHRMEHAR